MPASDVELRLCGSDGGAPWPYSIHWLLGFSALAGFAHAQPYTVNIAADETGAGTFTTPALNESGTIVQGLGIGSAQRFQAWPRVGPATTFLDTSGVLAGFTSLAPIPFNSAGRVGSGRARHRCRGHEECAFLTFQTLDRGPSGHIELWSVRQDKER